VVPRRAKGRLTQVRDPIQDPRVLLNYGTW